MINGLITAIRTLTRIPIRGNYSDNFASSLPWFPLVGFLIASLLNFFLYLFGILTHQTWNEAVAFFILLFDILITGALHLDGLADWADSLGAKGNTKKMLEIMKDSNSGVFGVAAVVLLLLAKWILLVKLLQLDLVIPALFITYITSRFAMVYLSVSLPYARKEGGTGEQFIKNANYRHLSLSFIISLILLFIIGSANSIIIFILNFPLIFLWKYWCKKNLNGITGDLLGAGSELIEIFTLFIVVLLYKF